MRYQKSKFVNSFATRLSSLTIFYPIFSSDFLHPEYRILSNYFMERSKPPVRIKNRCFFTGRSRFVISQYFISRMKFKELATAGLFSYYSKKSW